MKTSTLYDAIGYDRLNKAELDTQKIRDKILYAMLQDEESVIDFIGDAVATAIQADIERSFKLGIVGMVRAVAQSVQYNVAPYPFPLGSYGAIGSRMCSLGSDVYESITREIKRYIDDNFDELLSELAAYDRQLAVGDRQDSAHKSASEKRALERWT